MEKEKDRNETEQINKKNGKTKKQRNKKKIAIISISSVVGIFLALFIVLYFVAGNYFFLFALDGTYEAATNTPNEMIKEMPLPNTEREWVEGNVSNISVQEIVSYDGYKLRAFQIGRADNDHKWVITIHGYRGNALDNGQYAKAFFEKGYNVLMPNLKAHGISEGKYVGMGYMDRLDILEWIDYIISIDSDAKIVLHGVSMGASTVLFTTGENLPDNVVCAVEDCGYTNVYDEFLHVADVFLGLPFKNLLISSVNLFAKSKMNLNLKDLDCVKAVKKSKTPTLFIHGDKDTFVPFYMLDVLYNANPDLEKEKLVVNGATHAYSSTLQGDLYFNSMFDFINKYIKKRPKWSLLYFSYIVFD